MQNVGQSGDVVLGDGIGLGGLGIGGGAAFFDAGGLDDNEVVLELVGVGEDEGDGAAGADGDIEHVVFEPLLGFDLGLM